MESSTSGGNTSAPSDMNIAFIKRLKIAVATTIIRNKPPNVSAREYTESLARRLRQKEDNWRTRVRRLEDELLKTRQELALARLKDAGVDVPMARDFNWDDDNEESAPQEMEEEASEGETELAFPTPPCSSDDNIQINQLEITLKNNALFLHSISQLQSIPECNGNEINQTVLDSAISAVHNVENFAVTNCHGPWNHGKLLKDAVRGVVRLLECRMVGECKPVLESCDRLVSRLLVSLVEHSGLNNNQYQQDLCQLLTILGRTETLQVQVLHRILHHLQKISTMLRRTQEGKQGLDHVLFENAFYLCSIFEDVVFVQSNGLFVSRHHGQRVSRLKGDVILELHGKLEDCLLHVSREYPLYAQFIWRLTGALECMQVE